MKKIGTLVIVLVLLVAFGQPIWATETHPTRMVDAADLLDWHEEEELLELLDEISKRQQFDVVVVTVDSVGHKSLMEFADDYFDYEGYGLGNDRSGALLLINIEKNEWWITTSGYGIEALTDWGIDYMADKFVPYLSNGDFYEAFSVYAESCDQFVTQAKEEVPFDRNNQPKEDFPGVRNLLIALAIGMVVALIVTGVMKRQLVQVRGQRAATNYMKDGSLHVTERRDLFMYHRINRVARPKGTRSGGGSSVHRSSSGRSHGGGGGRF